ncbi:MAG: AAA family ATPase [Holophaga sp.]|nr:AAA family ATPase [Holophaga sp.]
MQDDIHDLGLIIDSKVKLLVIESWDELRVVEMLNALAMRRSLQLFTWSVTNGLESGAVCLDTAAASETGDPEAALRVVKADPRPNVYVFCDLHPFLEERPKVVRLLKEIGIAEGDHRPTLILLSHALKLPLELQRHTARFTLSLPNEDELLRIVHEEATRWRASNRGTFVKADGEALKQVASNLRGLSVGTAQALARTVIWDDGAISPEDIPRLIRAKFQLMDMQGVLSLELKTAFLDEVGGLDSLKQWLVERKPAFMNDLTVDAPKGMLLVGVQGSGKSLAAKAVAGSWGLPLLRLDFGCLYNKFFGETERNLRESLALAEQMSPCVLWVDELEKGLAAGVNDDGVSHRILGTLLTWMAERKSRVFIVATSNDIHRLPPELLRKGRFDELFFLDLPTSSVREQIFRIHLERRGLAPEAFDLPALSTASEGFSGAEIEQAVVSSLYAGQARGHAVDQGELLRTILATAPLSVVMAERLDELRAWAKDRTVMAD